MHVNMKDATAETSEGTWAMPSNASVPIVSTLTSGEQAALTDTLKMMEHLASMHPELAKHAADLRQVLSEVKRPASVAPPGHLGVSERAAIDRVIPYKIVIVATAP